jgi:hypothetical protein
MGIETVLRIEFADGVADLTLKARIIYLTLKAFLVYLIGL